MAVAIDLGEDNDLHPLNKEGIGYRLAMQAAANLYGLRIECSGPQVEKVSMEQVSTDEYQQQADGLSSSDDRSDDRIPMTWQVTLHCRNATGMYAYSEDKGTEIKDFEFVDEKGRIYLSFSKRILF